MIFHFTLKFFELFKCFRLMFHQVYIPRSTQIICVGQKLTIPAASLNIHWTAYISMYYFQQICCSLHCFGERSFSHLCPWGMVRKRQVIPKAHQHGVSSCALHQYDLNGGATKNVALSLSNLHILTSILWICVSLWSRFNKPFTLGVWS